jgi:hypothetical protein
VIVYEQSHVSNLFFCEEFSCLAGARDQKFKL